MTVALWVAFIVTAYVVVSVIVETVAQLTGLCKEIDTPDGLFGATWPISIPCLAVFAVGFGMAKVVWWVMTRTKSVVARLSLALASRAKIGRAHV